MLARQLVAVDGLPVVSADGLSQKIKGIRHPPFVCNVPVARSSCVTAPRVMKQNTRMRAQSSHAAQLLVLPTVSRHMSAMYGDTPGHIRRVPVQWQDEIDAVLGGRGAGTKCG